MVGDPGTEAPRPQGAPQVDVVPLLELHCSQAPDLNTVNAGTRKYQRVPSWLGFDDHPSQFLFWTWSLSFPALVKYTLRILDNHMADWKVIALISGEIEAVSGTAAQDRPGAHEWTIWEGPAADKAEALQSAEKADPRVDLEWMRIRYERDLNMPKDVT